MNLRYLLVCVALFLHACDDSETKPTNSLEGEWNWKSTCGGFVGCVYATNDLRITLSFEGTNMATKENGDVIQVNTFTIKSVTEDAGVKTFNLVLNDGAEYAASIEGDLLTIGPNSTIVSVYERAD
jgi:hypothetical protein